MAELTVSGLAELSAMFMRTEKIPFSVTSAALEAMAKAGEAQVRRSGESMGVRDPDSNVHILDNITHTKPKENGDGGYCAVTFKGTRTRGKTKTRNAEIAFVNEYGKRGQEPRPFVRQAAEQGGDAIAAPGEKILGDWISEQTGAR